MTERVASIAIKHLIHNIIPKIKEATWAELERLSSGNRVRRYSFESKIFLLNFEKTYFVPRNVKKKKSIFKN